MSELRPGDEVVRNGVKYRVSPSGDLVRLNEPTLAKRFSDETGGMTSGMRYVVERMSEESR